MVAALIDTSIVVDILRFYQPAHNWLATQSQLGVATSVWLEVFQGAQNRQKQNDALKLLSRFARIELVSLDFEWSINQLLRFKLRHNVDAFDCLIASASNRLQLPLYTINLKHFAPLLGILAQKPY